MNEDLATKIAAATAQRIDAPDAEMSKYVEGVERLDSFLNLVSGLGGTADRTSYRQYQLTGGTLDESVIEDLFRTNDIARRMASFRPMEATRQGWVVSVGGSEIDIDTDQKRLELKQKVQEAMIWARVYGGAVIVVGCRDGLDPSEPLNEAQLKAVDWLKVLPRTRVVKGKAIVDPISPWFDRPEHYKVRTSNTGKTLTIHPSRVVEFSGALTPETKVTQGWQDSVYQIALRTIADFDDGFGSVSIMLSEANQSVISIEGLIGMLTQQSGEQIKRRLELMNLTRGTARALFLDASAEKYENHELSFNGVALILDRLMMRVAAMVQIPVTILMGRSPAGENATGDADFRYFYDTIRTEQTDYLEPRLRELLRFLFLVRSRTVPDFKVAFNSLWQETERERAERELLEAQRDAVYIDRTVLAPEQVALGRFDDASSFIVNREALLAQLTEQEKQEVAKLALTPSDTATFTTVDEARAASGMAPWPIPEEGKLPLSVFAALQEAKIQTLLGDASPSNNSTTSPDPSEG